MAVYNGEQYMRQQLDSILGQLQQDDELVISYDQSTDGSWDILMKYQAANTQVKIYKNTTPGIVGNFNNALSHCNGDYIFISDQDDVWADNKRQSVLNAFKQSGADMVIHNGVHIDGQGKTISEPFFTMYRIGDGKVKNIIKPRYSGCCMAFTNCMKNTILPMPENLIAYDHWIGTVGEFMGKIAYNSDILLYHRLHGDNATPVSHRPIGIILRDRLILLKELYKRSKKETKR